MANGEEAVRGPAGGEPASGATDNILLRAVLKQTPMMAVYLDSRFNFLWVNPAYAATCRHDPAFFVGKNHFDLYPHEENQAIFQRVVDTGEPFFVSAKPFRFPDQPERGVTYWDWSLCPVNDSSGKVQGLVFTLVEVTPRVRAEAALRESEEQFRAIFENASDANLLVIDGVFADCNRAALSLFRADREQLVGRSPIELSPEFQPDGTRSSEAAAAFIRAAIESGNNRFEWVHRRGDGTDFWAEVVLTALTVRGRDALFGTLRDITARKRTEAALARMQQLESLGTLAGGIAHDFNNILTAILGNLSLLRLRLTGDDHALNLTKEALTACATAKGLSHQLLTFARGGAPVAKVVDLRPLLTQSAVFSARGSRARCVFDLGESPLAASVDKDQIRQVIQNLVINAAQAMPEGGSITVRADAVSLGQDERPPLAAGRYVRVRIEDEGRGIPADLLPRIFEPYFSTKAQGRGLGLAVCYSIMAKHGGHIRADPRPGGGTVFSLYFAAADAAAILPAPETPALTAGGGRVLVMDDDPTVAKVLTRMIEGLGYRAESVGDGAAALDAYRRAMAEGEPYAAVLLDLTVAGGMGGREAIGKLKAIDRDVKAVISSGYSDDEIMSEYSAHGFSGVLIKPYLIEEVSEVLRRIAGSAGR